MKKLILKVEFEFVTEAQKYSIERSVKAVLNVLKQFYSFQSEISEETITYVKPQKKGGVK